MKTLVAAAAVLFAAGCSAGTSTRAGAPLIVSTAPTSRAPDHLAAIPVPAPPTVTGTYPAHCVARVENSHLLPDSVCTPGSVNPAVTDTNIATTICAKGWTATVRPPEADTAPVKTEAMRAYNQISGRSTTELDHLVPLELGGSDDVSNLWPEPSDLPNQGSRNTKDTVERDLNHAVCAREIDLNAAQSAIADDWTTAEHRLGLTPV